MDANHSSMYGVNLFYDWQTSVQGEGAFAPTGSHMRVGAGLEYFSGSIETRFNGYYGVSSDVQVGGLQTSSIEAGTTAWQHVAPGADLSIGTDFSFWNAPWLKLTATGNYYAQTQNGKINGYQGNPINANLTAQLQVTPQLSINGGGTVGNGGQSSANVGFQLNLLAPPQPALFLADPVTNKLAATDISYKMLQPVQRNNAITTERYTRNEITYRTVTIAVTNSQGGLIPNATVALATPTAAVGSSSLSGTTNALGIAVIRNVPQSATAYNMTVTATGYPLTTSTLTVQSDVTQGQLLEPATATYTVTFTVQDAVGPVTQAYVIFAEQTHLTDANGTTTFTATGNGNYNATISKTGYVTGTQSVSVAGADVAVPVTLIATTSVPFHVQNANDNSAIAGATVAMDGKTAPTDASGNATINEVSVDSLAHSYSITAAGFIAATGAVTVNNTTMPVTTVAMAPVGQTATVNITVIKHTLSQNDSIGPPYVTGATVILDGQTKTTDFYGLVTFTNIARDNSSHPYTITAANYADYEGAVTVNAASVDQTAYIEPNNLTLTVNNITGSNNSTTFSTYELWKNDTVVSSGEATTPLVISGRTNGVYYLKIGTWQGGTAADINYHAMANIDQSILINGYNLTVDTATFPQQTWTIQRINYANGTEIPAGSAVKVGDATYNYVTGTGITANNVVNGIARASLTADGTDYYSQEVTIDGTTTTPVLTLPNSNSGNVWVNVSGNYAAAGGAYQVNAGQIDGPSQHADIVNGAAHFTTLIPGEYYFTVSEKQRDKIYGDDYFPANSTAKTIVKGNNSAVTMADVNVFTLTATLQDSDGNPATGNVYVDDQDTTPIAIGSTGSGGGYVWTNTQYRNLYAQFTGGATASNSALFDQNRTVVFQQYSSTTSVTVSAVNSDYFKDKPLDVSGGYVVIERDGLRLTQYYWGGETVFSAVPEGNYSLFYYDQKDGFNDTNNGKMAIIVQDYPETVKKLLPKVAYTNLQGLFDAQGAALTTGTVSLTLNSLVIISNVPVTMFVEKFPEYIFPTGANMSATYTAASGGTPQTLHFTSTEHPTPTPTLAVTTSAYTFTNLRMTL